ncbi:MAG: hypothetical protein WDZ68_01670 [Candidatus Paceibacterota bacterium]
MNQPEDDILPDALKIPFTFGLTQKSIDIIEESLNSGKTWDFIAKEVSWDKETAMEYYIDYLRSKE